MCQVRHRAMTGERSPGVTKVRRSPCQTICRTAAAGIAAASMSTNNGNAGYWSRHFGVRPKDLKRAVREVGNRVEDVEKHFEINRPQMPIGVPDMGTAD